MKNRIVLTHFLIELTKYLLNCDIYGIYSHIILPLPRYKIIYCRTEDFGYIGHPYITQLMTMSSHSNITVFKISRTNRRIIPIMMVIFYFAQREEFCDSFLRKKWKRWKTNRNITYITSHPLTQLCPA